LATTLAGAVLLEKETKGIGPAQLLVDDPYFAFSRVVSLIHPPRRPSPGVHPQSIVGPGVRLGKEVYVGPFVTLEAGAVVGDGAVIHHGVFVGEGSTIGEGSVIYPNVTVREGVMLGKRVIVHSGTVIGSDGFGFATHEGRHHKIEQVGRVVVEDDVEIGANVAIDRAALGVTRIGRGTKIDNLVQIAHNVSIGEDSLIVSQVGISGSTTLGHHVVLGGQVGLVGHLRIGNRVMVGAQSGIMRDLPDGSVVWGSPAIAHSEALKVQAVVPHLPEMRKQLRKLALELSALARHLKKKGIEGEEEV
ncbi:MAG TPA: UDP-3-O-(3-hydroxymyristoyl)glucosamine N-acyltransferase, partial [Nitrospiria bacterium]|nr:UDP-3-O-(3-hydroxymyristoyl)glucosamine N-acyltransferase [Nitrospiria bacterium]